MFRNALRRCVPLWAGLLLLTADPRVFATPPGWYFEAKLRISTGVYGATSLFGPYATSADATNAMNVWRQHSYEPTRGPFFEGSSGGPATGHLSDAQRRAIINAAWSKLGVPYQNPPYAWPRTTDCSTLAAWCYAQAGITLPRTAAQQYSFLAQRGRSSNSPGSLVFFNMGRGETHVGINLGNGWMIQAGSTTGVTVTRYQGNSYWTSRMIGSYEP